MSKAMVRVGDVNSGGGRVLAGNGSLTINGKPVAVDGSPVSCHGNWRGPHPHAHCRASRSDVTVEGQRIIFVDDVDSCGHKRVQGSPDSGG